MKQTAVSTSKAVQGNKGFATVIFSVTLIAVMGVASITPAFPVIRDKFGLNSRQVALLITFFTLPGVFFTPFYGILIDRYSRKKILIGVLILYGIFGSAAAFSDQFRTMLLFRFLQGLGNAPLTTLSLTLISDKFHGKQRADMMGYNAGFLSIGTALFPAIGGVLAAVSWNYPFLLSLFALAVAVAALVILEDHQFQSKGSVRDYFSGALSEIKKQHFIILYVCACIAFVVLFGSFLGFFPLFLADRFSLTSASIGLMISLMSVSTAATAAMMGRLIGICTRKKLMIIGFSLYAASLAGIAWAGNMWILLIPLLLFGTAQGLSIPLIQLILSENSPPGHRAVLMSFFSVVMNGGAAVGPLFAGLAFVAGGFPAAFLFGSTCALCAAVIVYYFLKIPS